MKSALNDPELGMVGNFCNLWEDWKSLAKISSRFPPYLTSALFEVLVSRVGLVKFVSQVSKQEEELVLK